MAYKQDIKRNEARVLVFLEYVTNYKKDVNSISMKLGIEYNYLLRTLKEMRYKEWVSRTISTSTRKYFYELTPHGRSKIEEAKKLLAD